MRSYIYILLFISIACTDIRKPLKATKECLMKELGEEKAKALFSSFRKYHRSNGKAKFNEFINDKKPELKEILEKCLDKKLRKLENVRSKEISQKRQVLIQMRDDIKKGNIDDAINKCKTIMDEELCEKLVKANIKRIQKKNK